MFNGHLEKITGATNRLPRRLEGQAVDDVEKEFFAFSEDGKFDAPLKDKTVANPVRN